MSSQVEAQHRPRWWLRARGRNVSHPRRQFGDRGFRAALPQRLRTRPGARTTTLRPGWVTLKEYRSRHEHLIQVASAEIDWLYDQSPCRAARLLLTDAGGIVRTKRPIRRFWRLFGCGIAAGRRLERSRQGTNGMGRASRESADHRASGRTLSRLSHRPVLHAAPIHDPDGSLVAVLDASTLNAQGTARPRPISWRWFTCRPSSSKSACSAAFSARQRAAIPCRPEFVNLQHDGLWRWPATRP